MKFGYHARGFLHTPWKALLGPEFPTVKLLKDMSLHRIYFLLYWIVLSVNLTSKFNNDSYSIIYILCYMYIRISNNFFSIRPPVAQD